MDLLLVTQLLNLSSKTVMREFDYSLDYQTLDFTEINTRYLYSIGRGEQGVLLVEPYKTNICKHWRFKDEATAVKSSAKIYEIFCEFKRNKDFIGMDMARKFLEMGFICARRYANHSDGKKYGKDRNVLPQVVDALTNEKAKAAQIFKKVRDKSAYDPVYQQMRKDWRKNE